MADLLECLIQIKALGHSIARLERFVADAPSVARAQIDAVLGQLLDAERAYARDGLGLSPEGPADPPGSLLLRWGTRRRAALQHLQACSAEHLGGPVDWPGRPRTSVADLVAIMLAHDTERIGDIQRLVRDAALSNPEQPE